MTSTKAQRFLFTPPEGRSHYKDGDRQIVCSSAPIPLWEIPSYLLKHPSMPGFHAPWLWCGWYGEEFLFKVIEKYYPGDIVYHHWGEPSPANTILKFPYIILREFDIPERFKKLVQVVDVALPNGDYDVGLAVGNNFQGLLPFRSGQCLECITQKLFGGKEPVWMLDNYHWTWIPQDCTESDSGEYKPPPPPIQGSLSLPFIEC
ncbi:hypothetical protein VKT23_019835 [Stygiomarasmius scandens]|uniref:Uncharacterized protein n=1 Tax=Marasmiellus scandens TaxID=2682957 RepID=A0ABR1IKQ3_9AGAR